MATNSDNKTPIIRPTPNLQGQAQVNLRKNDFDAIVFQKGYDVFVDKAIKCPCVTEKDNQALSSCKNCGGSGYVFINRYKTRMVLQSMNLDTKFKEWSEEKLGTVSITSRTEDELAFMDRVTLLNGTSTHIQIIRPIYYNNTFKARLDYPPITIEEMFSFTSSDEPLTKLSIDDFSIEGNIIEFTNLDLIDQSNLTISIRYKHHPVYHVLDLPREVIETEALDKTSGQNIFTKLPIHAIGRKAHYLIDEQNFSNDFLLDNSYEVICQDKVNIEVERLKCLPVSIYRDGVFQEFVPSNGRFDYTTASYDPATVQLNGTEVGTIESGETKSFPVIQDGLPVGSWNGTQFVIPSCPPPVVKSGVIFQEPLCLNPQPYSDFDEGNLFIDGYFDVQDVPNPLYIPKLDTSITNQWYQLADAMPVNGVSNQMRYVDVDGGQTFDPTDNKNLMMICKLTGLGIYRQMITPDTQQVLMNNANTFSVTIDGVVYDDWHLITLDEVIKVLYGFLGQNVTVTDPLTGNVIINLVDVNTRLLHTSSTLINAITNDFQYQPINCIFSSTVAKTANSRGGIYVTKQVRNLIGI